MSIHLYSTEIWEQSLVMFLLELCACLTFFSIDLANLFIKPSTKVWPARGWPWRSFLAIRSDASCNSFTGWHVFGFVVYLEDAKVFTDSLYSWTFHCFDPNWSWNLVSSQTRSKCFGKQGSRYQFFCSRSNLYVASWHSTQMRYIYQNVYLN